MRTVIYRLLGNLEKVERDSSGEGICVAPLFFSFGQEFISLSSTGNSAASVLDVLRDFIKCQILERKFTFYQKKKKI